MKSPLIFVLLFISLKSFSQDRFTFGIECFPNFNNITLEDPYYYFANSGFRPTFNFNLSADYLLSKRFAFTSGVGYMTVRAYNEITFEQNAMYEKTQSHYYYNYLFIPVGFKYYMGSFFINPEVAIGWNIVNRGKTTLFLTSGEVIEGKKATIDMSYYSIHPTTFPLFLSFGNETKVGSCMISLGVKGYYALNSLGEAFSRQGHYYGFGVFGGVSF